MFPYGHPADVLAGSNLLVAVSVGETEAENALFLNRQVVGNKFVNVRQPFVVCLGVISKFCVVAALKGIRYVAQSFEALVSDARQQVTFLRVGHQDRLSIEQVFEDVADHILAFLLIVEDGACHPVHLGIMLHKQPLTFYSFHHVFYCNTHQTLKKLTPFSFFLGFGSKVTKKRTKQLGEARKQVAEGESLNLG